MTYTISKDLLKNIKGLEENKISVINSDDYNLMLYGTELTDTLTDDRVEVGIKLVIRSSHSNELLLIDNKAVVDLDLIKPDIKEVKGYFQVIHTLDLYLRGIATISHQLMSRTHLMTLGVYYDSELNKIYHIMNLVVLGDDMQQFLEMFNSNSTKWEKIVDLISSLSIAKFDKMILSTLRIVKQKGEI